MAREAWGALIADVLSTCPGLASFQTRRLPVLPQGGQAPSQVGTAGCWPPEERVCPRRPGWAAALLSLRRVPRGPPRAGRRGCCAELPRGTACLPPCFRGNKWAACHCLQVLIRCEASFSAHRGCRLRKGRAALWSWLLSSRAPPPRAVLLIACPSLPAPSLWGRTPEELAPLPLSLCASVRSGLS